MQRTNQYQQPIGEALPDWQPVLSPPRAVIAGHYCRLEPLDAESHAQDLYEAYASAADERDWTYLSTPRPADVSACRQWINDKVSDPSLVPVAIVDSRTAKAVGMACFMRIDTSNGVLELGHLSWSPRMQRSVLGTEALWLMLKTAFELGYRRCEWKCDSLNAPSRAAAERLGFRWEGRFRQVMTRHNRNRDTDWLSIIDSEWPAINLAIHAWLNPQNFSAAGQQIQSLRSLMPAT